MVERFSKKELISFLEKVPLFLDLDISCLEKMSGVFDLITLPAKTILIKKGDPSDFVYIVVKGSLTIGTSKKVKIGPYGVIGEIAVLLRTPRSETLTTTESTQLLRIEEECFLDLLKENTMILDRVNELITERLKRNQFHKYIYSLFGKFGPEDLAILEKSIDWKKISKGEVLFYENDPSDGLYILISGRLQSWKNSVLVGEMIPGETVGELEVIERENRSVTVTAQRQSTLISIPARILTQLQKKFPHFSQQLLKFYIQRMKKEKEVSKQIPPPKIISVISLSSNLSHHELCRYIAGHLQEMGYSTTLVDRTTLEEAMNMEIHSSLTLEDPIFTRFSYWLNTLSESQDFVFLLADRVANLWTEVTIENADEILLVADADDSSDLTEIEQKLLQKEGHKARLLLVHQNEKTLPHGTIQWLVKRNVFSHHHIRGWEKKDIERIARFLSNQAVGLVLSGGGARAFAHLGLLHAFEKHHVIVDYVCGCNVGAIIGALRAKNRSFIQIKEEFLTTLKGFKFEHTFPIVSLFSGKGLEKTIRENFEGINIEDLWLPFFTVSSNLTRAKLHIHDKGPLVEGLLAGNSIPGLLPPYIKDGDVLMDGAILNNLPVDLLNKKLGGGIIYSSDVTPLVDMQNSCSKSYSISSWDLLFAKMQKSKDYNLPDIVSILSRARTIGSSYHETQKIAEELTNIYFQHPVEPFLFMDFDEYKEIEKIGYAYTIDRLGSLTFEERNHLKISDIDQLKMELKG